MNHEDYTVSEIQRDPAVYMELSNEYGWKLYSYLKKKVKDGKLISSAYEKVMQEFYLCVLESAPDDMERILYEIADRRCNMGKTPSVRTASQSLQEQREEGRPKSKRGGFAFWLVFLLLLALNLFCLWVIAGLLMDMGFLPEMNLGYGWFNAALDRWFR